MHCTSLRSYVPTCTHNRIKIHAQIVLHVPALNNHLEGRLSKNEYVYQYNNPLCTILKYYNYKTQNRNSSHKIQSGHQDYYDAGTLS